MTGQPYRDCRSPFACALENGSRICKKQTCLEQGSTGNACSTGEYCCGGQNSDGMPDPCPPPAERNDVGCYKAPEPPLLLDVHEQDQDCNNLPLPSWMTGANACANGSLSPSCSPLPMKCIVGLRTMTGELTVCAPATVNDKGAVSANSSRTKADRGCPVNYDETPIRVQRGGSDPDSCATDMDCQAGAPMGRCGPDPARRLQDGGVIRTCLCPAGSGKTQCPNDLDAGIESECLDGVPGSPSVCIESYVCASVPGTRYVQPKDGGFGCGLTAP